MSDNFILAYFRYILDWIVFGQQLKISESIYLLPLHVCKVSTKSEFPSSRGSFIRTNKNILVSYL